MNINVTVLNNKRLIFKDSNGLVIKFIENRLSKFGLKINSVIDSRDDFFQFENEHNSIRVLIDIMNPFVDCELIKHCSYLFDNSKNIKAIKPIGCVPGTEIDLACMPGFNPVIDLVSTLHWETQSKFNNQFNLYKFKRLKMFLGFIEKFPEAVQLTISELNAYIEKDEVFHFLLSYATGEEVVYHDKCLCCNDAIEKLYNTQGHPFIGYIPSSKSIYSRCLNCGLIFLNPTFAQKSIPAFYDLFDREDFASSLNSSYHVNNERCNLDYVLESKTILSPNVLDLGGGMGMFSKFLKTTYPHFNVNHSDFEIKKEHLALKELGVNTLAINFLEDKFGHDSFDLITMWEVIEHVPFEKLDGILDNIWEALKPDGFFTFSTPDFDSPLTKVLDFYYACPPFHLTCFSTSWLKNYFLKKPKWKIHKISYSSDLMDDLAGWSSYASRFAPGDSSRSLFKLINEMVNVEQGNRLCKSLLSKKHGTEVIFILQKI